VVLRQGQLSDLNVRIHTGQQPQTSADLHEIRRLITVLLPIRSARPPLSHRGGEGQGQIFGQTYQADWPVSYIGVSRGLSNA
jgi:hypothetical protein